MRKRFKAALKSKTGWKSTVWIALTGPFESIVEMACLMHDIGNPPFGHFGEAAINDWFRQRLHPEDAESQPLTHDRCVISALRLREGRREPERYSPKNTPGYLSF
ncbi:Deoxyguanosinetriphosphate triphospho hydrolase subgroup 1 [Salmonella bongori]|nr:Deoxyguanosinetriphosphate triphospho hydrolase subgroup 1 [Salmonella bongori]